MSVCITCPPASARAGQLSCGGGTAWPPVFENGHLKRLPNPSRAELLAKCGSVRHAPVRAVLRGIGSPIAHLIDDIEGDYHSEGIDDGGWVAFEDSDRAGLGAPGDGGDVTGHTYAGLGAAVFVGALVLVAGTSYIAGRAMAPSPASKNSYGIGGAVLGTVLGPIGLGILGAVALSSKR